MNSKEFKRVFDKLAQANNFEKLFSGWFKESLESIVVLDLQRSNFGNYYELNIKIFVQGLFDNKYVRNKDLVKRYTGDIFIRQPNEYNNVFNLEILMDDKKRKKELECLFQKFIVPLVHQALSRVGLKELDKQGKIFILPAVKERL